MYLSIYLRRGYVPCRRGASVETSVFEPTLCGVVGFQKILIDVVPKNVSLVKYV